jgi:hypothetical protein
VERRSSRDSEDTGGAATVPCTRLTIEAQANVLLSRANTIAIRHRLGEVVCVMEIVSPGNKASRSSVRSFVEKTLAYLRSGVHVLLVDPFPPRPLDPHSMHKLIRDEIEEAPFDLPADEPLLLVSYRVRDASIGLSPVAYLEPFRPGAEMPDMPAWIDADLFVSVPLERCYQAAWDVCPEDFRYLVERGRLPEE